MSVPSAALTQARKSVVGKSICTLTFIACQLPGVLLTISQCVQCTCMSSETAKLNTATFHLSEAEPEEHPGLLTGESISGKLDQNAAWSVTGVTLREQLKQFTMTTEISVVLDRRLDGDRIIDVISPYGTHSRILDQICSVVPDTAWCRTDDYVYLGPAAEVLRLPVLLDLSRKATKDLQSKVSAADYRELIREHSVSWDALSEPVQILKHVLPAGWRISNPDALPHDLWNAAQFPDMSFGDIATVLLNQFDLIAVPDAELRQFEIAAVNPNQIMERRYAFGEGMRSAVTEGCQEFSPEPVIRWTGGRVQIKATVQQHIRLQQLYLESRNPEQRSDAPPVKESLRTRRFTLHLEQPVTLGQLIDYFRQNEITVEIDREKDAAVQELLRKKVHPDLKNTAGISFFPQLFSETFGSVSVEDTRIHIIPAP